MTGKTYDNLSCGPETVGDFIELLSSFPPEWPVSVVTPAGGGIGIEHRERKGRPFVAIFGKNGGRFGENPLTEEEYRKQSERFLIDLKVGRQYTSVHGDHRTYSPALGPQAICYGSHYDPRIIERMVREGLIEASSVDLDLVSCS
jgi:hypothetical protein